MRKSQFELRNMMGVFSELETFPAGSVKSDLNLPAKKCALSTIIYLIYLQHCKLFYLFIFG